MLASSSVFWIRRMWLAFSRTNCLRVLRNVRISCVGPSGTKLARIRPCANNSEIQSASLTSVLRPGTFLICAALASTRSKPPSAKMCDTCCQYTPVASIVFRQPLRHRNQVRSCRREGARLLDDFASDRATDAGDHRLLVNVETTTTGMQDFHNAPPDTPPAWRSHH